VINSYPNKTAAWDHGVRPGSESRGAASATPTWEFVKAFPMKDGKKFDDPTGAYYKTEAELLQDFWRDRDPRFDKSIVWNGKLYSVSGKAGKPEYPSLRIEHQLASLRINPNAAVNSTYLHRYTGFCSQTNRQRNLTQQELQQHDVDEVVMRFAHVILNYAE